MTAAQDLVADPRAFIRHNIICLHGAINNPAPNQLQWNGVMRLKLEDLTQGYGPGGVTRLRNRKGIAKLYNMATGSTQSKATNYYLVSPAKPGDPDVFFAYICPYDTDHALSRTLGGAANLMFTAEMSGCSFGIGMPNANGHVLVMHSNQAALATNTSTAPQEQAQLQDLQNAGANARMLLPGAYRVFDSAQGIDVRATTVGIRRNGAWEFWYQTFNSGMDGKHMVSVTKIK